MNCSECGYIHTPYSVEDVMTPGFMEKFILHNNYLDRLGKNMLEATRIFYFLDKKRKQLEKYNWKHEGLSKARQKEWDNLEPRYSELREIRTLAMQKFLDVCKHENLPIPEWFKKQKWLST